MNKAVLLNPFGDELRSLGHGYGSDVSSQRLEPFEKYILQRARRRIKRNCHKNSKQRIALDLISGHFAANGLRLARMGYETYAIDFSPADKSLTEVINCRFENTKGILYYVQSDVRNYSFDFRNRLDLVTCQRGLHFLPFVEAKFLIAKLAEQLQAGALMFFSIGAVDCRVGAGYKHTHLPVAERWHPLEPELGEPIHVTQPLCLYKEEDLSLLFEGLNGRIVRVSRDDFGLLLVEFRKKGRIVLRPC